MEKRKKTESDQRQNDDGSERDNIRETGSCEEQKKVDDHDSDSSSEDHHTSCDKDEPCLSQTAQDESCKGLQHGNEKARDLGPELSHVTTSVEALELGASQPSNLDLGSSVDGKQEEAEECPEGAVGESRDGVLKAEATFSDDEKALELHDKPNTEDSDDEGKDENKEEEEFKRCFSCGKEKLKMKKCGACRYATYCDTACQKADWNRRHKKGCRNIKRFLEVAGKSDMLKYYLAHGPLQVKVSMEFIKHPLQALLDSTILSPLRKKQFVLLEIVGRYPHWFRPGCLVKDVYGNQTHILFYTDPIDVIVLPFPFPLPLQHFLEPGKFIWLVEPMWHNFLDGTVGIRIDHADQFELP